ncbi:MAG: hypothetical protein ACE5IZ_09395 [Dehalococcoidia bacterium]
MTTQTASPRACPRCRGSMILEKDWYGAYSTCISCGYVYEFGAAPLEELEPSDGPPRQRRRQPSHGKLRL